MTPVLVRGHGTVVTVRPGATSAATYGRACPEQAACRTPVPYQPVLPIECTTKPGQQYVVGEGDLHGGPRPGPVPAGCGPATG